MASDAVFEFDFSDYEEFFELLQDLSDGAFKKAVVEWFEASGYEFLAVVQDEIISRKVVDTRLLLNSFEKGEDENVWLAKNGGLTLTVGTNLDYVAAVNDGHWTCKQGESSRWVPGYWSGTRFTYDPTAETGMLLKQQWVEGAHFWEAAIRIFELLFRTSVEKKMEQWRDENWVRR